MLVSDVGVDSCDAAAHCPLSLLNATALGPAVSTPSPSAARTPTASVSATVVASSANITLNGGASSGAVSVRLHARGAGMVALLQLWVAVLAMALC